MENNGKIRYQLGNETFEVPENLAAKFEKENPNATVSYTSGGERFDIPVRMQDRFRKQFRDADYYRASAPSHPARTQPEPDAGPDAERRSPSIPSYDISKNLIRPAVTPMPADQLPGTVREDSQERPYEAQTDSLRQQVRKSMQERENALSEEYRGTRTGIGSLLREAAMAATPGGVTATQDDERKARASADADMRQLRAADRLLENSENILNESARKGKTNFVAGLGRGLWDQASKQSNWDMGITDLVDNVEILDIVNKADRGEDLTDAESKLLEAVAINAAVEGMYSGDLGRGYKAGTVTSQSIPFMIDFLVNPASGLGKTIAGKTVRAAVKKGLSKNLTRALTYAARGAGDVAGAAAMTSTTGAGRVAADAADRLKGQVQTDTDAQGNAVYAGRTGQETSGKAWGKAFGSTLIENYSEMLGNYFGPAIGGALRATGKVPGLRNVAKAVENISSSDWAKAVRAFNERAQLQGPIGEFAEEVAGGALNALFVGDQTLDTDEQTGVFNADNLIDTFLGVSILSGAGTVLQAAGYRGRNRELEGRVIDAKNNVYAAFPLAMPDAEGGSSTSPAMGIIENVDRAVAEGSVSELLKDIYSSDVYSGSQKKAIMDYARNLTEYKAYQDSKAKMESDMPAVSNIDNAGESGNTQGRELAAQGDVQSVTEANREVKAIEQEMGEEERAAVEAGGDVLDDYIRNNPDRAEALTRYASSRGIVEGAAAQLDREIADREAQEAQFFDSHANKETGNLVQVELKDGRKAYVVRGNVAKDLNNPDGGIVREQSSERLTVIPEGESTPQMVSIGEITNVLSEIDRQTYDRSVQIVSQQQRSAYDTQINAPSEQEMADAVRIGEETIIRTPDGGYTTVVPQAITADGVVMQAGKDIISMPLADYYGSVVDATAQQQEKNMQEAEAQAQAAETAQEEQQPQQTEMQPEQVQQAEQALPSEAEIEAAEMPAGEGPKLPLDEEGNTDYDTLLESDPQLFFDAYSQEFGQEEAKRQLQSVAAAIDAKIKSAEAKAEKETGINRRAKLLREASALRTRRDAVSSVLKTIADTEAQALETGRESTGEAYTTGNAVTDRWASSTRYNGAEQTRTLPNGTRIRGRWVLTEAEAATPSHNPETLQPSEGFPVTVEGYNVNDNDYRDKRAFIIEKAQNYDGRAIDNPVFVKDGAVVSGNNRTMSGIVAARQGTDGQYLEVLRERAPQLGFTEEQVSSLSHPRLYFEITDDVDLTTEFFSEFNASESKRKSLTDTAIATSKRDTTKLARRILTEIGDFDRIGEMYRNREKTRTVVNFMLADGIINRNDLPQIVEDGYLTAYGQKYLESILLGSVIDAERLRMLNNEGMRQYRVKIIKALVSLLNIKGRPAEYNVLPDLNEAVSLLYESMMTDTDLSILARERTLENPTEQKNAGAFFNAIMLMKSEQEFADYASDMDTRLVPGQTADLMHPEERDINDIYQEKEGELSDEERSIVESVRTANRAVAGETQLQEPEGSVQRPDEAPDTGGTGSVSQPSGNAAAAEEEVTDIFREAERISERENVDTEPTEAQKKAGNYRKGHIRLDGHDVSIENPKGSVRSGRDADGKEWSVTMANDYGYFRNTVGRDKDHVDVIIGPNLSADRVYVMNQIDQRTGEFDEHKVLYGFNSAEEAMQAYLANYEEGWKPGQIVEASKEDFYAWLDDGKAKTQPFGQVKESVKEQQTEKKQSRLVSDERMDELRKRLKAKLGQLNAGMDPEMLLLGGELAVGYVERGITRFADYAKGMVSDLGESIRPYLKLFYNAVRDWPGAEQYRDMLDTYDYVSSFDLDSLNEVKTEAPEAEQAPEAKEEKGIFETAEDMVNENVNQFLGKPYSKKHEKTGVDIFIVPITARMSETEYSDTRDMAKKYGGRYSNYISGKKSRTNVGFVFDSKENLDNFINAIRDEQQRQTDTETVARQAESVAAEAKAVADAAEAGTAGKQETDAAIAKVEQAEADINGQLALLGYYDSTGASEKDENESLGKLKAAERKFMKDIKRLSSQLAETLGLEEIRDAKGKRQYPYTTLTVYEAEGTIRLGIPDTDLDLYVKVIADAEAFKSAEDSIKADQIMYRLERKGSWGGYTENMYLPADVTFGQLADAAAKVIGRERRRLEAKKEQQPVSETVKEGTDAISQVDVGGLFAGLSEEGQARLSDFSVPVAEETEEAAPEQPVQEPVQTGTVAEEKEKESEPAGDEAPSGETIKDNENERGRNQTQPDAGTGKGTDASGDAASGSEGTRVRDDERKGKGKRTGRRTGVKASTIEEAEYPLNTRNFILPENTEGYDGGTELERTNANIRALEIMKSVLVDKKEISDEERNELGKFQGWGGLSVASAYSAYSIKSPSLKAAYERLQQLIKEIDPSGVLNIKDSISRAALTSYFTPVSIVRAIHTFLTEAGFKKGSILDPSLGTGKFISALDRSIAENSQITGVELDWLTGNISRQLFPDARIEVTGYQKANLTPNSYDVVMSNVPFGDIAVTDLSWGKPNDIQKAAMRTVHGYYALKTIENAKEGGLIAYITTSSFLDTKANTSIRQYIANNTEVIGAIRLPSMLFRKSGTEVVTDIILLRKLRSDETTGDFSQKNSEIIESEEMVIGESSAYVNRYFAYHPENVIGTYVGGGLYSVDKGYRIDYDGTEDDVASSVRDIIRRLVEEAKAVGNRTTLFNTASAKVERDIIQAYKGENDSYTTDGNIVVQDGTVGIKQGSNFEPLTSKYADEAQSVISVRTALKKLIAAEIEGETDSKLTSLRAALKEAYDSHVAKYGRLTEDRHRIVSSDIDRYILKSLEKFKDGKFTGLSDIFEKNTIKPALDINNLKTPVDAVNASLSKFGDINNAFMESVLGEDWVERSGDLVFAVPFGNGKYEVRDKYLSGDVKTKLEFAEKAAEKDASFKRNVDELKKVLPPDVPMEDIAVRMGARWIPDTYYDRFIDEMGGSYGDKVLYVRESDTFEISVSNGSAAALKFSTDKVPFSKILDYALSDKPAKVTFRNIKGDIVVDDTATKEANSKIEEMKDAFVDWIYSDTKANEDLARIYNDKFNRTVRSRYDGSNLHPVGLANFTLRPHQKDAVWMLLQNNGGIIDHIVGAGKTLVMITAAMEMRRMGIAKKPMIIALKATVQQMAESFTAAYPFAKVLVPTEADFKKENRKRLFSNIALNDYDCIILSHEQFKSIDYKDETWDAIFQEQISQLVTTIETVKGSRGEMSKKQLKALEKTLERLRAKQEALKGGISKDKEFLFENLGVDHLFVDESHQFKNLFYTSSYDRIKGMGSKKGSNMANNLLAAVRFLQRYHQGDKGVTFLSGTTLTNSFVEIYNILNYLRPNKMAELGYSTFDAWASDFAVHDSEPEYGVTNELKAQERFRKFVNLPELSRIYNDIADVRNDGNLTLDKPKVKQHIETVESSPELDTIMSEVNRMIKTKNGSYFGKTSNAKFPPVGLWATEIASKASISVRLVDPELPDSDKGKIAKCAAKIREIYDRFSEDKGIQLVFCDIGVSEKNGYSAYGDLLDRLVNTFGIPKDEVVDIHEASNDKKREELFNKAKNGEVRVIIGGTKNLGTGVNVQDRLIAIHNLDVPWTPASLEQRIGRGARQGNRLAKEKNNNEIDVYFYATENSLDVYRYQLLEAKGKMFQKFRDGSLGERTYEDMTGDEEGGLDPAQVVSILSGNPIIFEKSKTDKAVEKMKARKRSWDSSYARENYAVNQAKGTMSAMQKLVERNGKDIQTITENGFVKDKDGVYPSDVTVMTGLEKRTFDKPKEAGEYILKALSENRSVSLSGFGMSASIVTVPTDDLLMPSKAVRLNSYNGMKHSVELSTNEVYAGTAYRTLLKKVIDSQQVYEREYEKAKSIVEKTKVREKDFPQQKELDELLERQKAVNEEYDAFIASETVTDENTETVSPNVRLRKTDASAERKEAIESISERVGIGVEYVDEVPAGMPKGTAGYYDIDNDRVVIVRSNNANADEMERTYMHEVVGHMGMRRLFGNDFDTFLWEVYENASREVRERIVSKAQEYGLTGADSIPVAVEEYLAELAERKDYLTAYGKAWLKVRNLLMGFLRRMGLRVGEAWSDADLRYLLMLSYDNLNTPDGKGDIFSRAREIANRINRREAAYSAAPSVSSQVRYRITDKEVEDMTASQIYDAEMKEPSFRAAETWVDAMKSVKVLQETLARKTGKEVQQFSDVWTAENHRSSRNRAEFDYFKDNYFKPLVEQMNAIAKDAGMSIDDIVRYMMAKHAIERNTVFAEREAKALLEKRKDKAKKIADEHIASVKNVYAKGNMTEEERDRQIAEIESGLKDRLDEIDGSLMETIEKMKERDFSGITAMFPVSGNNVAASTELAQEFVDSVEKDRIPMMKELWSLTNAATKKTLETVYLGGQISRDRYEQVSSMFRYYVPLRGFDETVAEDVYDYMATTKGTFSQPLKQAKGRKSKADNPVAYILQMASSAIVSANRNLVKQRLYNLALTHESDLLSVNESWLQNMGTELEPDWVLVHAETLPEDTPAQIAGKIEAFNRKMEELEAQGMAMRQKAKAKDMPSVPYRVMDRQKGEHTVRAMIGGKEYTVYVNGNPRAAQAINGLLTKPKSDALMQWARFNRELSQLYTTRSPKFVIRNLIRDSLYALFATSIREDSRYNRLFRSNLTANYGRIWKLMKKYHAGKLDTGKPIERYMQEFITNGGETGYTATNRIDEYKELIGRIAKKANRGRLDPKAGWESFVDLVDYANRCAEDMSRFAAYVTSRQSGRSVERSISDAKNITVNFNTQGTLSGALPEAFKTFYLFFNAGIQGLSNFYQLSRSNRRKFYTAMAMTFATGIAIPALNALISASLGGDDDEYLDMPEWLRRNSLMIGGGGYYLTIPLPIEVKAVYGLGDIAYNALSGRMRHDNVTLECAKQITGLLPLDPLSEGAVGSLVPDIVSPIYQAVVNRDFTGRPIYMDYDFNKLYPAYRKAYAGTNRFLVKSAEVMNSLTGGDIATPGAVDINPAIVEHLVQGYLGGMFTFVNEMFKTGSMLFYPEDRQLRNVPLVNVILQKNDERTLSSHDREEYYHYMDEAKLTRQQEREYGRTEGYDEKLIDLMLSPEYERMLVFDLYKGLIDDIKEQQKQAYDRQTERDLQEEADRLVKEAVDELNALE